MSCTVADMIEETGRGWFTPLIDEVRICNRASNAEEAQAEYSSPNRHKDELPAFSF